MPRRKPNAVYRTREHLTGDEVDRLINAAKANRWDATMILVSFRHGLRSSELVDLRWGEVPSGHLGHQNIQPTVLYTGPVLPPCIMP